MNRTKTGIASMRIVLALTILSFIGIAGANCASVPTPDAANWNIDRLVGCKMSWVPGSGDAKAETPRREALHAHAGKDARK